MNFIIYHDLNVTVFSKRFSTINIWIKFNTEHNICCRVLHCVRDEKWIYNDQFLNDSYIVLHCNAWSNHLSDLARLRGVVQRTWVDQKVLKQVVYLLKYTTELCQTYTEYATTISWFVSVVRMTQYARRYMTSSFDDVMQQWPGVKNVRNCLFPAKYNHQHLCFMWQLFFRDYNGLDVTSYGPITL